MNQIAHAGILRRNRTDELLRMYGGAPSACSVVPQGWGDGRMGGGRMIGGREEDEIKAGMSGWDGARKS